MHFNAPNLIKTMFNFILQFVLKGQTYLVIEFLAGNWLGCQWHIKKAGCVCY